MERERSPPSLGSRYVIVPVSADDDPDSDLIAFRRPRINMQSLNANARPGMERMGVIVLTRTLSFFQIFKCAWVLLIVASYWVTEALPLAITSLIPVALLPILGINTNMTARMKYSTK